VDAAGSGQRLEQWLRERGVTEVDVCGLATDYCVAATAKDAEALGFGTRVLLELSAAVNPG
jgi:nicotinamidase/pyrazinamidase